MKTKVILLTCLIRKKIYNLGLKFKKEFIWLFLYSKLDLSIIYTFFLSLCLVNCSWRGERIAKGYVETKTQCQLSCLKLKTVINCVGVNLDEMMGKSELWSFVAIRPGFDILAGRPQHDTWLVKSLPDLPLNL